MPAVTPPVFIQAGSHTSAAVRQAFRGLLGGRGGIMAPGHLAVSQNGTPNMSVNVAEGFVAIPGSESSIQGVYLCEAQGTTNLAIGTASASPRIDLVVARIRDAAYSTGPTSTFALEVVQGTPGASPVAPATPANSWVLARVAVAAGASSITNANVTDYRTGSASLYTGQNGLAGPAGMVVVCTSATRPTAPYEGLQVWETDTGRHAVYRSGAWVYPYPLGRLGYGTLMSNSAAFTSIIYPIIVNVTLPANRRLRIDGGANVQPVSSASGYISLSVCNSGGTILNQHYRTFSTLAQQSLTVSHLIATTGAGGATSYRLGAFSDVSSFIPAGSSTYAWLSVTDEGPA
jgi:hypothetical protein